MADRNGPLSQMEVRDQAVIVLAQMHGVSYEDRLRVLRKAIELTDQAKAEDDERRPRPLGG